MLISAGQVITPEAVLAPGWVEVTGETIHRVGDGDPPGRAVHAFPRETLAPGFVDMHVHGGGGHSFSTEDPAEALAVIRTHRASGTTTMVASLVTASEQMLLRQISSLAELVQQGELVGLHLEGPWLSPHFAGAHDKAQLRPPSGPSVDRLLSAGKGTIRMVTLAPELEHGLDAVARLVGEGVTAAMGHTSADYDLSRTAIEQGVTVGTHLFNAMPSLHHREPGPTLALLEDKRVTVEVIPDGVHLHPRLVGIIATSAPGRVALVTDAMAAAGGGDGTYRLGDLDVVVADGVARLAGSATIAGSTLTMLRGLQLAVQEAGVPVPEAVRAATSTPAQALGLGDVGAIRPGACADLVVLDESLTLRAVLRRGIWG